MVGEVFVNTFSNPVVLDTYATYINNFNDAIETAGMESNRKSAFSDFIEIQQLQSADRWLFLYLENLILKKMSLNFNSLK